MYFPPLPLFIRVFIWHISKGMQTRTYLKGPFEIRGFRPIQEMQLQNRSRSLKSDRKCQLGVRKGGSPWKYLKNVTGEIDSVEMEPEERPFETRSQEERELWARKEGRNRFPIRLFSSSPSCIHTKIGHRIYGLFLLFSGHYAMTSNGVEVNSRSGSIRGAASLESLDSVTNSIQRARASSALKSEQRSVSRFGGEKANGRLPGTNSASTKNPTSFPKFYNLI